MLMCAKSFHGNLAHIIIYELEPSRNRTGKLWSSRGFPFQFRCAEVPNDIHTTIQTLSKTRHNTDAGAQQLSDVPPRFYSTHFSPQPFVGPPGLPKPPRPLSFSGSLTSHGP